MDKWIIDILDLSSWGQFKEVWKWARIDGHDITKSYWLPKGYSPSDRITERMWNYLNKND